jgi:hypothetical protein
MIINRETNRSEKSLNTFIKGSLPINDFSIVTQVNELRLGTTANFYLFILSALKEAGSKEPAIPSVF